jgi:hypothetical protein
VQLQRYLRRQAAGRLGPQWLTVGDLNGDGHLDIVASDPGDNTVSVTIVRICSNDIEVTISIEVAHGKTCRVRPRGEYGLWLEARDWVRELPTARHFPCGVRSAWSAVAYSRRPQRRIEVAHGKTCRVRPRGEYGLWLEAS